MFRKFKAVTGDELPSLKKVQMVMPAAFKNYLNTRMLLDCTEVLVVPTSTFFQLFIEAPGKGFLKNRYYSQYKGGYTIKFLVGCAPNAVITYISKSFPGPTSDKEVVIHSKILDKLVPGDGIMVDKGFLIHHILPQGVTINMPSGLWGKRQCKQFTEEEVVHSEKVSTARSHVERAIGYIKNYGILGKKIRQNVLPHIDQIIFVCSMLSTLDPVHINALAESVRDMGTID